MLALQRTPARTLSSKFRNVGKVGADQAGVDEAGAGEVGTGEVGTGEVDADEVGVGGVAGAAQELVEGVGEAGLMLLAIPCVVRPRPGRGAGWRRRRAGGCGRGGSTGFRGAFRR